MLGWFVRLAEAIPIAPHDDGPAFHASAFERGRHVLEGGDLLGSFPEGRLTPDGTLDELKGGVMKPLRAGCDDTPADVECVGRTG